MRGNRLVDAMPPEVAVRLWERGQVVRLRPDTVVERGTGPGGHAHFPLEGALTLRRVGPGTGPGPDGGTVGVAAVGPDSALVLPPGPASPPDRLQLVAATPGRALRVDTPAVLAAADAHGGALRALLDAATGALVAQLSQHVLCAQQHQLSARAGHWLGMVADRAQHPTPTHAWLAGTVGVDVERVPALLAGLEQAGAVRVSDREVSVVDRELLAEQSCACAPVLAPTLRPPPCPQEPPGQIGAEPGDERLTWLRALAAGVPVSSLAAAEQLALPAMYRALAELYTALGVSSRSQAVLLAARRGWLSGTGERSAS